MAERERWVLWLPVMVGAGVGLYFALPVEPPTWLGWAMVFLAAAGLWAARGALLGWCLTCALGALALGFAIADQRGHDVAAPVLASATGAIWLEGRILEIEPLEQGERLVLDRLYLDSPDIDPPARVRLKLTKAAGGDLRPGQWIGARVLLLPPPPPLAPGGYDFARQAWFLRIGAVGSALGRPQILETPSGSGWDDTVRIWLADLRHDLTRRIVTAIDRGGFEPGIGAVAAAIVTAERGPIPPDLLNAYRNAGLAHILVIAGMHMSMVAGLVFVVVRGLLASVPPLALRYPIKKWTALAALLVTAGYLIISGAPIPTERAFIMNAIILVAVLVDREAISLRSVGWAALALLLTRPEAVTGPSFQMSFAAVVGLISGYEALGPFIQRWHQRPARWRSRLWPYVAGILLTTLVAGTATAPYTVYNFNRYASFSLLGNALAVPVVGFWIMPAALLAIVLLPFGLDGWGWQLMASGISLVDHIARTVSDLPGATIDMRAIPAGALALFTFGALWLCLWRQRWRLFGLAGMAAGILLYAISSPPDVLIDSSGRSVAARDSKGELALVSSGRGALERETWARLAGQGTDLPPWPADRDSPSPCDAAGCLLRVGTRIVGLARRPEGLAGMCDHADVVVSVFDAAVSCPRRTPEIFGSASEKDGAIAVWLGRTNIAVETVAEWRGARPWSRMPEPRTRVARKWENGDQGVGMIRDPDSNSAGEDPPSVPEP
jgi:competence protein ComEC